MEISCLSLDTFREFSLESYSTNSYIFQLANPECLANSNELSPVTFLLSTIFIICELEHRARGPQDKIHALNHEQNWKRKHSHNNFVSCSNSPCGKAWLIMRLWCSLLSLFYSTSAKTATFILNVAV